MGQYWFRERFKKAQISYGRDYILKTADELMESYLTLRTKGAPDFSLDEALEKFYRASYQNSPIQLEKYLKKMDVEPFPHLKIESCKGIITDFNEFNAKLYFGEWSDTIPDIQWITMKAPQLRDALRKYVTAKALIEPASEPAKTNPAFN